MLRSIPPAVPGIHFLSGGMSEEESTLNLQALQEVRQGAAGQRGKRPAVSPPRRLRARPRLAHANWSPALCFCAPPPKLILAHAALTCQIWHVTAVAVAGDQPYHRRNRPRRRADAPPPPCRPRRPRRRAPTRPGASPLATAAPSRPPPSRPGPARRRTSARWGGGLAHRDGIGCPSRPTGRGLAAGFGDPSPGRKGFWTRCRRLVALAATQKQ